MAKGKLHLPADLDLDTVVAKPGAGRPPAAFHEEPIASPPPTSVPVPIETIFVWHAPDHGPKDQGHRHDPLPAARRSPPAPASSGRSGGCGADALAGRNRHAVREERSGARAAMGAASEGATVGKGRGTGTVAEELAWPFFKGLEHQHSSGRAGPNSGRAPPLDETIA